MDSGEAASHDGSSSNTVTSPGKHRTGPPVCSLLLKRNALLDFWKFPQGIIRRSPRAEPTSTWWLWPLSVKRDRTQRREDESAGSKGSEERMFVRGIHRRTAEACNETTHKSREFNIIRTYSAILQLEQICQTEVCGVFFFLLCVRPLHHSPGWKV